MLSSRLLPFHTTLKGSLLQDAQYHELESVDVGGGLRAPALELQKPFGGVPDGDGRAAGAAGGGGPGNASAPAGDVPALHSSSKVSLGPYCVACA